MKRQLSKKDIEEINQKLDGKFEISKKESVILQDEKFIIVNGEVDFFYFEGKIVPTIRVLQEKNFLKSIVVDMGAIKFVIRGADIMRPGIVEIDDGINAGDVVCIVDSLNKKAIAVGVAAMPTEELRATQAGKVIRNIHYVGDDIWRMN